MSALGELYAALDDSLDLSAAPADFVLSGTRFLKNVAKVDLVGAQKLELPAST